jgi:hypothetical protein
MIKDHPDTESVNNFAKYLLTDLFSDIIYKLIKAAKQTHLVKNNLFSFTYVPSQKLANFRKIVNEQFTFSIGYPKNTGNTELVKNIIKNDEIINKEKGLLPTIFSVDRSIINNEVKTLYLSSLINTYPNRDYVFIVNDEHQFNTVVIESIVIEIFYKYNIENFSEDGYLDYSKCIYPAFIVIT